MTNGDSYGIIPENFDVSPSGKAYIDHRGHRQLVFRVEDDYFVFWHKRTKEEVWVHADLVMSKTLNR